MEITMAVMKIQTKHQLRGDKIIKREIIKVASGNPFADPWILIFCQEAIRCSLVRKLLYQMTCCFPVGKQGKMGSRPNQLVANPKQLFT